MSELMPNKRETCFIDGNNKITKIGFIKQHALMKCDQCGLQFLNCNLGEETLNRIYSDYYKVWNLKEFQAEVSEIKKKTFQSYLSKINPFIKGGRLLDIGCATGELLEVFEKSGFDVYGVEISSYGIKKCVEQFGKQKIIGQALGKNDFLNEFFDIITLADTFEHFQDPGTLISIIDDILIPGGFLMIITPDTSSLSNKLMRMYWPHYKEEHIFYYNRSNIVKLFSDRFDPLILTSAHKTLSLKYCSGILKAYSKNIIYRIAARLFDCLPKKLQFYPFSIKTGEMFVLFRKKTL